MQIMYTKL